MADVIVMAESVSDEESVSDTDTIPAATERITEDWRISTKKSDVHNHFVVEYINDRPTQRVKCRKCFGIYITSGNTSNMRSHLSKCPGEKVGSERAANQGTLNFQPSTE